MENNIINRIREVCSDNQLSVNELSKRIGIAQRTTNSYLNEGRMPSIEFILKLSSTFKLNMNWLLNGEGDMYNEPANQIEYSTEEKLNIASDSNPEYGKDEYREKYYKKLEEENEQLKKTIADKDEIISMYKTGQIIVVGQNSPKGIHK